MQNTVVIDIKESYCAVAVFSEGWAESTLKGSAVVKGSFLDRESGTIEKLKGIIENHAPDGYALILLVPRHLVQVKSLKIPAKNEAVLKKMLEFEIPRHFPIPPDQLINDYLVALKTEESYTLNLAGFRKSDFETYFNAAQEGGLPVDEVSFSSAAWLPPAGQSGADAKRVFIEVMQEGFEMSIVEGRRIHYSRLIRFKPAIEDGVFLEDALGAISASESIAAQIADELNHIRLVSGIEKLENYTAKVYIAGGGILRKTIAEYLARKPAFSSSEIVSLPADGANPGLDYVARATGAEGLNRKGARFNFIPVKLRRTRYDIERKRLKIAGGMIVFLLFVWMGVSYSMLSKTAESLKNELKETKAKAANIEKMQLRLAKDGAFFETFNQFVQKPSFSLNLMSTLTGILPPGTHITSIDAREDEITITGISGDAASLIKYLEASPLFMGLRMVGAVKTVGDKEKFKISMEYE